MRLNLVRLVALLATLSVLPVSTAGAATEQLSDPVLIFSTERFVTNPRLASDPSGDVHLVFSDSADPNVRETTTPLPPALMYARLHNGRWSVPTDIISGGTSPEIAADNSGYLHLVWGAPDSQGQKLLYSRARASAAGSADGWSAPITVDTGLGPGQFSLPASIQVAADDTLYVVYSNAGGGIRFSRSTDHGQTWSAPSAIRMEGNTSASADSPRLAVGPDGRLTVTWTEYTTPRGWPPVGVFTSRSTDGGATWSDTVRVAGGMYALLNVMNSGPNLLRVWHGAVEATADRTFQWSTDGGDTWSTPALISPRLSGGLTGFTAMAADSLGRIHLVTSISGKQTTEEVWHTTWDGQTWSTPDLLSSGARGTRSVEMPALAISRGNQMHVAYEDDFKRIWYRGGVIDAPALPARTVDSTPLPAAVPAAPEMLPAAATPRVTPVALTQTEKDFRPVPAPGLNPLLVSAAPIVLLGLALALRRRLARP